MRSITRYLVGGINYRDTVFNYSVHGWDGANNWYSYYDWLDGSTDGLISKTVWLSTFTPNVRAVLSWFVRGTTVNSMGSLPIDWDIQVKHPDGYYFIGGFNSVNSFESIDFVVNKSGYYTFNLGESTMAIHNPASHWALRLTLTNNILLSTRTSVGIAGR